MLQISDLVVRVGAFTLGPINLEVQPGGYLVLLGRSGSGKTVLLETIAGRHQPLSGHINLQGVDLLRLAPEQRGVGFMYQDYSLFPHLSVADNIEFGLRMRAHPAAQRRARGQVLGQRLGITDLLGRRPRHLSGGEKQRVALARALAIDPDLLLLDEPLSALDYSTKQSTAELIRGIHRDLAPLVVHVTHDIEEAITMGTEIALVRDGKISHRAPVGEIESIQLKQFLEDYL